MQTTTIHVPERATWCKKRSARTRRRPLSHSRAWSSTARSILPRMQLSRSFSTMLTTFGKTSKEIGSAVRKPTRQSGVKDLAVSRRNPDRLSSL
uniref:Uncharacterized protein n=1 Tax=Chromera velia CCMP2878 TaxID=1169474 RepID=A0A0G4HJK8_9ALVE|eukprot:Cvel_7098.t1-p1 / transcript=Cvel_7098.t1 / gene=Cvel_7098 / organism=Chromera_velia_CCMP2878 / gene_product=hypothetical protein / transcript_product=hypothetical protein / location=Cvel_scaffold364:775-1285(+) / protein_length=93 / sequence_SO=supercontig / SO=protein_coding / is_pseudo=false